MADIFDIAGRINSTSQEQVVTTADQIKDETQNKKQNAINADVARHETEIHGTGGIDSRLTDVEQMEQIVIDGGEAQIATGSDFTNPDAIKRAKMPTVGAIVDGLNDGVYDVSKRNPTAGPNSDGKFTLDYILSNADTLIPTGWRHGGMTISFVDSSDNKYVQYLLKKDEWSANTDNWEEINTKSGKYLLMTFGATAGYINASLNNKISLSYSNPSIGVSNLINVNKTVPQIIQLSNLWSIAGAPSYVITDEDLIALQVVTGVSTATIDSTNLPDGARFLIANSKNKNGVIGTSNLPIADSGIPIYVALKLLNNTEEINKFIIRSASIGNSSNCYINSSIQIGSYLSKTNLTFADSSINCTNLLCVKKEHNLSLTNLWSNSALAPSYIILDKDFKVLDIQSGISSAIINIDNLPTNSYYLIANSNTGNSVVTVDKFYPLINTGISVIVLTEILSVSSILPGLEIIQELYFEEEEITSTSIEASASATSPASNYLMGRLIECSGGQIETLHFDSTPNPDIDYKIAVLQNVSGNSYKCISVTTIRINSQDTDLSEYSIQIPVGKIMVAILSTSGANIKYTTNSSLDTFENKGIRATGVNEGSVYNLDNAFSFIAPSYYFTMRLSIPLNNKIDEIQKDIEALEDKIENVLDVDTRFKDKNIVIFGDSITYHGGDNCDQNRGWTKYFKQHFEFKTIRSYARSGATLTATANTQYDIEEVTGNISDNNVLYNQVNRMIYEIQQGNQEIPDYVFVALGTNDGARGLDTVNDEITIADDIGTDYSQTVSITTCTTFIRMLRYFHDMMWNVNKDCQIIILTPLQKYTQVELMYNIANQISKCARYLSWNVIDQFGGSGLSSVSEYLGHAKDSSGYDYTADGLHPTVRGAKLTGDWIAQQAKTIMRI